MSLTKSLNKNKNEVKPKSLTSSLNENKFSSGLTEESSKDVLDYNEYTEQVFENQQQNLRRAQGQSSWEQGTRAIGKGVA